jgi:RHS repeat-associated protein
MATSQPDARMILTLATPNALTDIVVAGGVGEYPLALSRTYNSRNGWGSDFGFAGGWHLNYDWGVEDSAVSTIPNVQPSSYIVDFPDGRMERFVYSSSDPYYRATAGLRERFQPLNQMTKLAYLILPDGGKVEFKATNVMYTNDCCPQDGCGQCNFYYWSYAAQAIIDPHGLRTSLTYNIDGTLNKVTEPAGRYIQFYWRQVPGYKVIDHVTASDGRTVQYYYINSAFPPGTTVYTALDHIVYYGSATWTARYKYRGPNVGPAYGLPLLWTCDDPMYDGPMKRIAYTYRTTTNPDGSAAVFGQISSENYYDGTNPGVAVSTLTVTGATTRTETRGDGKTRTFTYQAGGYLTSNTDFKASIASQTYDTKKYINSVTDRNGRTTNFIRNALTGVVTQIQYPLTQGDTPGQTTRPTVNYTYGSASCADANNRDANNPYYVCTATDEGGHVTSYTRAANKRVTRIDYPDGGYETFAYNGFGQITSHRMTTGGTETFTYDSTNNYTLSTYRNPSNATGNPTASYQYDGHDWISGVTDALNHTTNFAYNLRGQVTVTTRPTDPVDGLRHTITNAYNPDGTLASKTDELGHVTSSTYDDYRRLRSMTTPTNHTTNYFYDANGVSNDYRYTDASVTYVTLPSGKKTKTIYDENRRKTSVTAGFWTADAATTSYGYDNVGNLRSVTNPLDHNNVSTLYDERNRPYSTTVGGQTTTVTYDTSGRQKSITRPNGQVIRYDTFDAMNRVTQQTATQSPDPNAVTKYSYYTSGLLYTVQDPRLVSTWSTDKYTYSYDNMGRKTQVQYPLDSYDVDRTEQWSYDTVGRLQSFTNRNSDIQTFTYDALNRMTGFSWNDGGLTPSVSFGYDAASRLTSVNNANANITRAYFNDNLLQLETESITGASSKTVTSTYDADGNRASTQYPDNYTFNYTYTGRNQLQAVTNYATFGYDARGNLTTRTPTNGTQSTYIYDNLDRVTRITHALNGTTRTFDYDYDSVGNRKWTKRDGSNGDVFGYDLNDQVIAVLLDIPNPDRTPSGDPTITYDWSGNRSSFAPYGPLETYTVNNLNQYTGRGSQDNPMGPNPTPTPPGQEPATYDYNGNMTTDFDGSIYLYDAQNRLLTASKNGVIMTFTYDGLNRQVSRSVTGQPTAYNVWDGWDLVEEYQADGTITAAYLYGAGGLVKNLVSDNYYYQDGSGSTSHLTDANGDLLEWYRYDLQGTPVFYDANNNPLSASAYGVRHLFTGQQWYSDIGLYDLRNRFYSPDLGRFLQPDPIDFDGDATNLYRYCGNNPVTSLDPLGLWQFTIFGGYIYGGYITFGRNSGQWNFGGYVGAAGGLVFSWNPHDQGLHDPGANLGYISSGGVGAGLAGLSLTGYGGGAGNSVNVAGRVGNVNGSFTLTKAGISSNASGFTFLGGLFAGVGANYYSEQHLPPPPPGGSTYVDPNGCGPGCVTLERVVVTGTPVYEHGSSGGPTWGNSVGIFDTTGFNAVYTPNFYGYTSSLPTTLANPFGSWGEPTGGPISGSIFGQGNFYSGLDPVAGFLSITIGMGVGAMEPGLGCFVAGTPVLMANGTEKAIEVIQAGEAILAWNDQTRQTFQTRVIKPLHHEAKAQTLFDIELEDGRRFTVNNNHPIYVIEDDEFILTRDLAARFANGQPITFQDNKGQPVRIANIYMRKQQCKVYNLEVEGQAQNGHTYYAGGVLVHNRGRNAWK